MARQFTRTRGRLGSPRKSVWIGLQPAADTVAGGSTLVASLNAAALALRPFTIVRTHLTLMVRSDQSVAPENQTGAWGNAVVSDQAVGVGITALPLPETDIGSSFWFAHQMLLASESTLTDRSQPAQIYEVDSKAMRKVEVGEDLVFVLESAAGGGMIVTSGGRTLVKTN